MFNKVMKKFAQISKTIYENEIRDEMPEMNIQP